MKNKIFSKQALFLFFLIGGFLLISNQNNQMFSQELPLIPPCYTDYDENPPYPCVSEWQGPYIIQLCSNEFQYEILNCNNPDPCCFQIEYYDRFVDCQYGELRAHFYDVQVVLIKPTSENCDYCFTSEKDKIIRELMYRKFQENKDFFQDLWGRPECAWQNHKVTPGGCFRIIENYELPCSEELCCAQNVKICFDEFGNVIRNSLTYTQTPKLFSPDWQSFRECNEEPINCNDGYVKCDINLNGCDSPCNLSEWAYLYSGIEPDIPVPGCPNCYIKIYYGRRTTDDCIPPYYDYTIESITKSPGCDNCLGPEQQYLDAAIDWVLKNGGLPLPQVTDPDPCLTNYRTINSACWSYNQNLRQWIQCDADKCCMALYKICYLNGTITTTYLGGSNYVETCIDPDCSLFCTSYPVKNLKDKNDKPLNPKIQLKETSKSYAVPNPTTSLLDIHYISEFQGIINIKIFDILGNILINENIEKNNKELVYSLNIQKFKKGKYFYKIIVKDIVNCFGNFTVY